MGYLEIRKLMTRRFGGYRTTRLGEEAAAAYRASSPLNNAGNEGTGGESGG
jgi:hypothetical protein